MARDSGSAAGLPSDAYRQWQDALNQVEEYRRMLDTASVLGAVGDFDGRFLVVSDGWRHLLGHSPERLVGTDYLKLVHSQDLERVALALGDVMAGTGASGIIDLRLRAHDGSFRWISMDVRADREARRIYCVGQDLTERRLMDETLRGTEERLRRLAADVSQQIRTSMNGIVGRTSLALSTELTVEQRNYLGEVQRSAERLLEVVNQMLDITQGDGSRAADAAPSDTVDGLTPPPDAERSDDATPGVLGLRVLLAEDDVVNALVATRMLERLGCTVISAGTGRCVMEVLSETPVDLVLMDLRMPEIDGLDATRMLRQQERRSGARRTPVIALTADAMDDDQGRCLAAGMDGFLSKPITLQALEREIRRVFIGV